MPPARTPRSRIWLPASYLVCPLFPTNTHTLTLFHSLCLFILNPTNLRIGSTRASSPDCPPVGSLAPHYCPASADSRSLLYSSRPATRHTPHTLTPSERRHSYAVGPCDGHRLECGRPELCLADHHRRRRHCRLDPGEWHGYLEGEVCEDF